MTVGLLLNTLAAQIQLGARQRDDWNGSITALASGTCSPAAVL